MMRREVVRLAGAVLLGGVAILGVLAACGRPSTDASSPLATATAGQPVPPVSASTATPTPGPTTGTPLAATPQPTGPSGSDILAQGKLIFDKTAGGIGCAYCHGLDGRGAGPAGITAANIRGKNEGDVRTALQGGVPMMGFIKLTDEEITAVVTYLQYLNQQP